MSEGEQHDEFDEYGWEPTPLAEVLGGYETPRGRGRPKKGEEVQYAKDEQYFEVRAELVAEGITPLENQGERGAVRLQKESVRHRVLVYLFAQGGTARNVFEQLGGKWDDANNKPISGTGEYSYQHLLNIRKQPWFQAELLKVIEESGSPLLEAKLQLEQMASLETIIAIRDCKEEKGATRLAAANSLLDRFLGKPAQQVRIEPAATTASHENEAAVLRERLKALETEAHNLNAAFTPTTQQ